jgi:hypothetical protein
MLGNGSYTRNSGIRRVRGDVTKAGLREEVFSARSVPKCYKQDKFRVQLVVRQSQES